MNRAGSRACTRACARSILLTVALAVLASGCARFDFPFSRPDRDAGEETARVPVVRDTPDAPAPTRATRDEAAEGDLWRRLAVEIRMAPGTTDAAREAREFYAANTGFLAATAARAEPYLHFVLGEIERRALPYEIALIPVVESGYAPNAMSPHGAAGLWQIMAATGRHLGLTQTRWYDGRFDVVDSTRAALDYLESLRDRFRGDWLLAFAAFNCGEGTVERAMERNRRAGLPTDFHSLDLPAETERYVPKLLALTEIFAQPEAHGLELPRLPDAPYFETVEVGSPLDLAHVIEWTGTSAETFDRLNPGFRTRFIAPGNPSRVIVPRDKAVALRATVAALPAAERTAPRTHEVARGETLSHIAAKSGVSVAALRSLNGLRGHRIRVGQPLLIPVPGTPDALREPAPEPSREAVHVIVPGDTLWDLARLYGTSAGRLARLNGLGEQATLRPGHELRVPAAARRDNARAPGVHYEVRPGDSLWTISRRFKVSVDDLRRWNGLSGKQSLQPGQKLVVHVPRDADLAQEI